MASTSNLSIEDLLAVLEPLIRRVVREELEEVVKHVPALFYLNPDTPLYEDMQEILQRQAAGQIKLYSHAEVWDE
jgi:hypothetical protein